MWIFKFILNLICYDVLKCEGWENFICKVYIIEEIGEVIRKCKNFLCFWIIRISILNSNIIKSNILI